MSQQSKEQKISFDSKTLSQYALLFSNNFIRYPQSTYDLGEAGQLELPKAILKIVSHSNEERFYVIEPQTAEDKKDQVYHNARIIFSKGYFLKTETDLRYKECDEVIKLVQVDGNQEIAARVKNDRHFYQRVYGENAISNIQKLIDVDEKGNQRETHCIAMQRLQGENLLKVIKDKKHSFHVTPLSQRSTIGINILKQLKTNFHDYKLLYGDLKDGNILLEVNNLNTYLHDFETVTEIGKNEKKNVRGSPRTISPEQQAGIPTLASDLFSFGVLLHGLYNATDYASKREKLLKQLKNLTKDIQVDLEDHDSLNEEEKEKQKREAERILKNEKARRNKEIARIKKEIASTSYVATHLFKGIAVSPEHRFQITQFIQYLMQLDYTHRPDVDETIAFLDRIQRESSTYDKVTILKPKDNAKLNTANLKMLEEQDKKFRIYEIYRFTQLAINKLNDSCDVTQLNNLRQEFMLNPHKDKQTAQRFMREFINQAKPNQIYVIEEFNVFDRMLLAKLFKNNENLKFKAFDKQSNETVTYEVKMDDQVFQFQLKSTIYRSKTAENEVVFRIKNEENIPDKQDKKEEKQFRTRISRSDHCLKYDENGLLKCDLEKMIIKKSEKPNLVDLKARLDRKGKPEKLQDEIKTELKYQYIVLHNDWKFHHKVHGKLSCDNILTIGSSHILFKKVIEGENLEEIIKNKLPTFNIKQRFAAIGRFLRAEKFLHDRNIIHGDAKDTNFIDNGHETKAVDFDASVFYQGEDTSPIDGGSPIYIPHEYTYHHQGKDEDGNTIYTPKWDISCLTGIILQYLGAEDFAEFRKSTIRISEMTCEVPYKINNLFKNIGISEEHRYQVIQFIRYMTHTTPQLRPDIDDAIAFFDRLGNEADVNLQPVDVDANEEKNIAIENAFMSPENLFKLFQLTQQAIDKIKMHADEIQIEIDRKNDIKNFERYTDKKALAIFNFANELSDKRVAFMNNTDKSDLALSNFITDFSATIQNKSQDQTLLDHHRNSLKVIFYNLITALGHLVWGKASQGVEKVSTFFRPKTQTRKIAEHQKEILEDFAKKQHLMP